METTNEEEVRVPDWMDVPRMYVEIEPTQECYIHLFGESLPVWRVRATTGGQGDARVNAPLERRWDTIVRQEFDGGRRVFSGGGEPIHALYYLNLMLKSKPNEIWLQITQEEEIEFDRAHSAYARAKKQAALDALEKYIAQLREECGE